MSREYICLQKSLTTSKTHLLVWKPELEAVPICDQTLVFFDLETTGLGRLNNIIFKYSALNISLLSISAIIIWLTYKWEVIFLDLFSSSYLSHNSTSSSSWELHLFNVMPDIPITLSASEITGLEVRNGILNNHGKKVNTSSISVALDSFFLFPWKI